MSRLLKSAAVAACMSVAIILGGALAAQAQDATPPASDSATTATPAPAATTPTPKRGCEDCHGPGSKYSLYAEAMAVEGHPPIKAGEMASYQSCMGCHRATGKHPMAEIVHPAHLYSKVFLDKYTGNCFSCHVVENGVFLVVPGTTQTKANGIFLVEPDVVRPGEGNATGKETSTAVTMTAGITDTTVLGSAAPWGNGLPDPIPAHHPPFNCAFCHSTGAGAAAQWPPDHVDLPESQCQDCHEVEVAAPTPLDRIMAPFLDNNRRR